MAKALETGARPQLPTDDLDYALAFATLAGIHARMKVEGQTSDLLLQRGHARFALGNYLAAAFDAERVVREQPVWQDAQFLKGQSCLAMAAVKVGEAPAGIGVYMPPEALPPWAHLLSVAQRCFESVLGCNPDDAQARRALALARDWANRPEPVAVGRRHTAELLATPWND